jgi:hypothetical protein
MMITLIALILFFLFLFFGEIYIMSLTGIHNTIKDAARYITGHWHEPCSSISLKTNEKIKSAQSA